MHDAYSLLIFAFLFNCFKASLPLESLLFDFSASIVERTLRLLDPNVDPKELIPIVKKLMENYPYERQKRYVREWNTY